MVNTNQMLSYFKLLCDTLANESSIHSDTLTAAAITICNLLADNELYGVHDLFMREGILNKLTLAIKTKV